MVGGAHLESDADGGREVGHGGRRDVREVLVVAGDVVDVVVKCSEFLLHVLTATNTPKFVQRHSTGPNLRDYSQTCDDIFPASVLKLLINGFAFFRPCTG